MDLGHRDGPVDLPHLIANRAREDSEVQGSVYQQIDLRPAKLEIWHVNCRLRRITPQRLRACVRDNPDHARPTVLRVVPESLADRVLSGPDFPGGRFAQNRDLFLLRIIGE